MQTGSYELPVGFRGVRVLRYEGIQAIQGPPGY